jgi:hypothetical protein
MSKKSRSKGKKNYEAFIRYMLYECLITAAHWSKECRSKGNNKFFWTPVWTIRHVLYECYASVRHRCISNIVTRLIIKASMLHSIWSYFLINESTFWNDTMIWDNFKCQIFNFFYNFIIFLYILLWNSLNIYFFKKG